MKHLIKIESTPHGVLGVRHAGLDQQYCEAGELVILKWQPDAKWGLQEAHYTDGDGNIVPIDLGNGNGVVSFMMPDKNITINGTFKMFVSQDWTEGTNPSKGKVLTVGNNGEPAPISVDELANQITEGDNDLVDAIDRINPFKGWYTDLASLQNKHPSPQIGDYAYVKSTESTDPAAIYECTTAGTWADSGTDADTSNVQTFASSQEVNEVHIVNDLTTGGTEDVLSAEQGKKIADTTMELVFSENLLNPDEVTPNKIVGRVDGLEYSNNGPGISPYIAIPDEGLICNHALKTGGSRDCAGVVYDYVDGNYVFVRFIFTSGNLGSGDPAYVIKSSEQDKYIRFNIYLPPAPTNFALCGIYKGTTLPYDSESNFIPYHAPYWSQKPSAALENDVVKTQNITDKVVTKEKFADGAVDGALVGGVEEYFSFNLINFDALTDGAYILPNGSTGTGTNKITDYIKLDGKKVFWGIGFISSYGQTQNVGAAVYNTNKEIIRIFSAGDSGSYDPVDVDEGAEYIRLTYTGNYLLRYVVYAKSDGTNPMGDQSGINTPMIDDYYEDQIIKTSAITSNIPIQRVPSILPAYSSIGQNGFSNNYDSISANTYEEISATDYPSYLKCCHTISFKGYLADTLSGTDYIRFGLNRNSISGKVLDITSTQAIIKRYDSNNGYILNVAFTHGLTIKDFVMCEITFTWYGGKLRIISSGGSFVQEWQNSQYSYTGNAQVNYGRAFIESSITLTNVKLTQSSDRYMKPVWVIGDSYTSMSQARWTYQLINDFGIDGFLLDGYAGAPSNNMVPELEQLLKYGTPKYHVWCLGMIDGAVIWKYCSTKVEMLCRERGINLIYQTIPWPTGGSKSIINQYIKESDYRYIDGYSAVCSDDNGTWYDGMNDDGTHPTTLGAKALAGQVLVDFPEIANYK